MFAEDKGVLVQKGSRNLQPCVGLEIGLTSGSCGIADVLGMRQWSHVQGGEVDVEHAYRQL